MKTTHSKRKYTKRTKRPNAHRHHEIATPKRENVEGYTFQNGAFCFSDDIDKWMYGKTRIGAKYPDLF